MKKILKKALFAITLVLSLFICIGVFSENEMKAKIGCALAALLICPLPYLFVKLKMNGKKFALIRGIGVGIGCVVLVISIVFFADHSLDEKAAVEKAAMELEEKYQKYDAVSIKGYELKTLEETENMQIVSVKLTFNAVREGKVEKRQETYQIRYDEDTLDYIVQEGKEEK